MYKYKLVLNAFGEGAGAAPAGAGTSGEGQVAPGSEVGNSSSGSMMDTASADISFDDYVKQHKDEASKWFQKQFNSRHRDYAQLKERAEHSDKIMHTLADKYGVDANDYEGVAKAFDEDSSWIAEKAMEEGLTVEQYRKYSQMENDLRMMREQRAAEEAEFNRNRQMDEWDRQANNLKAIFPSFDLDTELANPEFVEMLRNGITMDRAFYALHGEEITTGAMEYTAQAVRQATVEDMASRKNRPRENGLSSQAAAKVSKDVHNLTKKERAEMAARSMRESIRF